MLQSSFVCYFPVPLDAGLARFYTRHLFFGFVYRSLGDAELSSPPEDKIARNGVSVRQNRAYQFFGLCGLAVRSSSEASKQFLACNAIVTIKPMEAFLISEIESNCFSLGSERRFVMNNDSALFAIDRQAERFLRRRESPLSRVHDRQNPNPLSYSDVR